MRKLLFLFGVCVFLPFRASAQMTMPPADVCEGRPDRVLISAGQSVTWTGTRMEGCLSVAGTLNVNGARVTFGTLHLLAGGTLRVTPGSQLIVAETTPFDGPQFSTGIILEGRVEISGTPRSFTRMSGPLMAGQNTVRVENPGMIQVGDEVVIADTRAKNIDHNLPFEPEVFVVVGVSGDVVTLNRTASINHPGAVDADGGAERFPHLGILTRDVLLASANPNGIRGHMMITRGATGFIRGTQIQGMGRTGMGEFGTEQIGRYAAHFHMGTVPGFVFEGNSVVNALKWGVTLHHVNGQIVRDNVLYDAQGAGIVMEDGTERDNVVQRNLVIRVEGNFNRGDETWGIGGPLAWKMGACFGVYAANVIADNVAANCVDGYHVWGEPRVSGLGGLLDWRDNEGWANIHGVVPWIVDGGTFLRQYDAHAQLFCYHGYPTNNIQLVDWTCRGAPGETYQYAFGIESGDYTMRNARIIRPRVSNKSVGIVRPWGVSGDVPGQSGDTSTATFHTVIEDAELGANRVADVLAAMAPASYIPELQPYVVTTLIRPRLSSAVKIMRAVSPNSPLMAKPDTLQVQDYQGVPGDSFDVCYREFPSGCTTTRAGIDGLVGPFGAVPPPSAPPPPPPPPPGEVCGDGVDNDGDGQIDEGCSSVPPPPPPPGGSCSLQSSVTDGAGVFWSLQGQATLRNGQPYAAGYRGYGYVLNNGTAYLMASGGWWGVPSGGVWDVTVTRPCILATSEDKTIRYQDGYIVVPGGDVVTIDGPPSFQGFFPDRVFGVPTINAERFSGNTVAQQTTEFPWMMRWCGGELYIQWASVDAVQTSVFYRWVRDPNSWVSATGTECGTPPSQSSEICGDGIDNDHDGQIDESCAPSAPRNLRLIISWLLAPVDALFRTPGAVAAHRH